MSSKHHHYTGAVRVSYDARGIYQLACPTGTVFASFFEAQKTLPYGLEFDLERDRITLHTKNLNPKVDDPAFERQMMFHKYFSGEIRFFDDCGRRISAYHVQENILRVRRALPISYCGRRPRHDYPRYRPETFRKAPVAYTGYGGGGSYGFVGEAVTQEIKANQNLRLDEEFGEFKVTGRMRKLPDMNLWDYKRRNDWRHRSWKRHRGTQWKDR